MNFLLFANFFTIMNLRGLSPLNKSTLQVMHCFLLNKEVKLLAIKIKATDETFVRSSFHCVKYCNLIKFPGAEILWKYTVSARFRVICANVYRNCAFRPNSYTRKSGEITVFYAVLK